MVQNGYCYGHFCGIRNQVRLPTLSLSCGCIDAACTSPRKLSLLPLIASTTTEACSLPESLSGQRKRMLGLSEDSALCSATSPPFHSIRVYSPHYIGNALCLQSANTVLCSARLCVHLYRTFLATVEWPFCQDILITGVSPDPHNM